MEGEIRVVGSGGDSGATGTAQWLVRALLFLIRAVEERWIKRPFARILCVCRRKLVEVTLK